jgi:hypothetical protein
MDRISLKGCLAGSWSRRSRALAHWTAGWAHLCQREWLDRGEQTSHSVPELVGHVHNYRAECLGRHDHHGGDILLRHDRGCQLDSRRACT